MDRHLWTPPRERGCSAITVDRRPYGASMDRPPVCEVIDPVRRAEHKLAEAAGAYLHNVGPHLRERADSDQKRRSKRCKPSHWPPCGHDLATLSRERA